MPNDRWTKERIEKMPDSLRDLVGYRDATVEELKKHLICCTCEHSSGFWKKRPDDKKFDHEYYCEKIGEFNGSKLYRVNQIGICKYRSGYQVGRP
jgi:hypothetical protein